VVGLCEVIHEFANPRLTETILNSWERVVRSIDESLDLKEFNAMQPKLEAYLTSIAGYQKNRHAELPEPLRHRIDNEWSRGFAEWGYPL
jgi:hypothetical protein